jgi:hypothetical protein
MAAEWTIIASSLPQSETDPVSPLPGNHEAGTHHSASGGLLRCMSPQLSPKRRFTGAQRDVRNGKDCVAKLSLRRLANRDSVGMGGDSRERSMMERREDGQGQFFCSFDLDDAVPSDHLVRQIDGVLNLGWVHKELAGARNAAKALRAASGARVPKKVRAPAWCATEPASPPDWCANRAALRSAGTSGLFRRASSPGRAILHAYCRSSGRASAPTIPHPVQTMRGQKDGTGTSSGQRST